MLTYHEAQKFYDALGKKQDWQFYEEPAIKDLIAQAKFAEAKNIVEFGCGTGRLATRLLQDILSDHCHYLALDISQTMVDLCEQNIKPYSARAECYKTTGEPVIHIADQTADRFISTYVLDLLTEKDIAGLLNEAHRILSPGAYLCLASLTHGVSPVSKLIEFIWQVLYKLKPSIVGGCRPVALAKYLQKNKWHIIHDTSIESFGVSSEVVIAVRI